ncbi:hypothetical protein GCM10010196_24300 [Agromyces mediolanus]|uniref:Uncharacterized protein n=1 Tax=Agromyces mediolanus TaxID=41986 RepID=A0A918CLI4_AGRME|nr:hypothetical protein GCM10010196_24300 [Agromyces mediolanus]GLJ72226.1 hypothetical protein GCM10017583_14820 [Agromyces mediolanus]
MLAPEQVDGHEALALGAQPADELAVRAAVFDEVAAVHPPSLARLLLPTAACDGTLHSFRPEPDGARRIA